MITRRIAIVVAVVVVTCGPWVGIAQQPGGTNSNAVWNNTSPGAVAARRPGRLVQAGIARVNEFQAFAFSPPQITAQEDDPDLVTQLKIQVIQTLFDNLNTILLAFNNVIRAEGGLAPFVPTPIRPGGSSSLGGSSGFDISSLLGGS
jgi:hypothetical protein